MLLMDCARQGAAMLQVCCCIQYSLQNPVPSTCVLERICTWLWGHGHPEAAAGWLAHVQRAPADCGVLSSICCCAAMAVAQGMLRDGSLDGGAAAQAAAQAQAALQQGVLLGLAQHEGVLVLAVGLHGGMVSLALSLDS